jgi:hypothetical protein
VSGNINSGLVLTDPSTTIAPGYTVTNTTNADNGDAVYGPNTAVWTLVNFGTVVTTATAALANGVALTAGGSVTNGTTGLIESQYNGVDIAGQPGTVCNIGTIIGTAASGVDLGAGGAVGNAAAAALIAGYNYGIYITGGAGAVANSGTIVATNYNGVALGDGGTVTNAAAAALIAGYNNGVRVAGGVGTVGNSGTIVGLNGKGVALGDGGTVSNAATTALISGPSDGVRIDGGAGSVGNWGTIVGSNYNGIRLSNGGGVTNAGAAALISGYDDGVDVVGSSGSVGNSGTIVGGRYDGVTLGMGGTVANSGAIIGGGGTAVYLGGTGANRLILYPGYAFGGAVVAVGTGNALELGAGSAAAVGTLSGLGTSFVNFATVSFDSGSRWVLGGSNTVANGVALTVGSGATLTNAGTLDLAGSLVVDAATPGATGATVINDGTIASLAGTAGTAVSFGAVGGAELVIDAGSMLVGVVAGVQLADTFDLPFLAYGGAGGTATLGAGNVLHVVETAGTFNIDLDPAQSFAHEAFAPTDDETGGTAVSLVADTTPPALVNDNPLNLTAATTATISASLLGFDDSFSPPGDLTYTVATPPADGTLLLNGASTTSFTQADIDSGLLTYRETNTSATADTFGFTVTDAADNITGAHQFSIAIAPLLVDTSVPGVAAGGPYSGTENSAIKLAGLSVSVAPNTNDPLSVVLSVAHGTLTVGKASGASLTLTGTAATIDGELAGASYQGALNYYGSDTLSLTATDTADGKDASASAKITLADTSVPSARTGGPYSGNENSPIALSGLSVSVAPNTNDPLSVVLSVAHGTLTIGKQSGASLTLTGTAATLDSELAGASYQGALNYYGSDTLSLTATDTADGDKTAATAQITLAAAVQSVSFHGGNGVNNFTWGNVNGTAVAGNGLNRITAGSGNDMVKLGDGLNWVTLGGGNDSVTVGDGFNTVALGNGNDSVTAGDGVNWLELGNGTDSVTVGGGFNTVVVGNGNDKVVAGDGLNQIALGGGTDSVTVGSGFNTVILGSGHDTLATGNGGSNEIVFTSPAGLVTLSFAGGDELVFANAGFDLGVDDGKAKGPYGFDDLTPPQPIAASLLSPNANGTFAAAGNRFAYNQNTGQLYYDAHGNAPGSTVYLVADLTNHPHLTAADLFFTV